MRLLIRQGVDVGNNFISTCLTKTEQTWGSDILQ